MEAISEAVEQTVRNRASIYMRGTPGSKGLFVGHYPTTSPYTLLKPCIQWEIEKLSVFG